MAKILVADDDSQILRLVGLFLEQTGHDVILVQDPCEVSRMARESTCDAIVLDVQMEPISGFEVLQELRQDPSTAAMPILFLSGRAGGEDRVRGLREGADDYLTKPFELEELKLRIERLITLPRRAAPEPGSRGDRQHGDRQHGDRQHGDRQHGDRQHGDQMHGDPKHGGARHMGRYEVGEVIGQGTMGTVYRGWDPRLERPVALKTIRLENVIGGRERSEMLERLRREAVTVARFNHPNIVTVYDMWNVDGGDLAGNAFIAMEYVEGVSLSRYLERHGAMTAAKLIPVALGVARALEAAHERQVVHRDVKPGNVLLGRDGSVKVTDFGVAYLLSAVAEDDPAAHLSGTPGYVPPESLRQEPYTAAGDLFGLGATLYEAAEGRHPLGEGNLRRLMERTIAGDFLSLEEVRRDLPRPFSRLVMRLLDLDPARRPDAAHTVALLEKWMAESDFRWGPADLPADL